MTARTLRRGGITLLGAGLLVGGTAHAMPRGDYSVPKNATIKMKLRGKGKKAVPYFSGTATVSHGAKLTIVNTTNPKAIGPHTFSLVRPSTLPEGEKAEAKCGGGEHSPPTGLCLKIALAHKFDAKTGKVAKPIVDAGGKGWNASFGKTGDSWYTETKGDKYSRTVTAKAGTTLTYFCAVHPNMVGHIKVVK